MSRKLIFNLTLIALLLLSFPLLWLYNQRLNYRKFLTLNTKFSLRSNVIPKNELSSPTYVLKYFNQNNLTTALSPIEIEDPNHAVLGRLIQTGEGDVEVYEYGSNDDAKKDLQNLTRNESLRLTVIANTVIYKNLAIVNKNNSPKIKEIIEGLK